MTQRSAANDRSLSGNENEASQESEIDPARSSFQLGRQFDLLSFSLDMNEVEWRAGEQTPEANLEAAIKATTEIAEFLRTAEASSRAVHSVLTLLIDLRETGRISESFKVIKRGRPRETVAEASVRGAIVATAKYLAVREHVSQESAAQMVWRSISSRTKSKLLMRGRQIIGWIEAWRRRLKDDDVARVAFDTMTARLMAEEPNEEQLSKMLEHVLSHAPRKTGSEK